MYSVKFLTDEEFDRLPAKDIEDKIGVAYPESGEAFVRQSGSGAMDVFTAIHELEHLKGNDLDEHFDTENGCYYKDSSWILPALGAAGGFMLGGPGGAATGMSLAGGAKSAFGGNKSQGQDQGVQNYQGYSSGMEPFQGQMEPNVVQAPGTGDAAEKVGSSTGGVKGLASQFQDRQTPSNPLNAFGNYSGRAF